MLLSSRKTEIRSRYIFKKTELLAILLVILFVFQKPLESISTVFSYIDELPVFFAICIYATRRKKRYRDKNEIRIQICLVIFVIVGLLSNIIFKYQRAQYVLIDVITNLKFYVTIYFARCYFSVSDLKNMRIVKICRSITVLLFTVFLLDRFLHIYPQSYRYGIGSAVLFFGHPTYLAGVCVFLVSLLSFNDTKKNKPYIVINLIMLFFTLRGKALAGVAIYMSLYWIVFIQKTKLKKYQIIILAALAVAIAWSQISFYFIRLSGVSSRSVILQTSIKLLREYFPIGTGFGTFASHSAGISYSPIYVRYGFEAIHGLGRTAETGMFIDDQFWPIIIGQTGAIGIILYLTILYSLFSCTQSLRRINPNMYIASIFCISYLLVSSTAEPAFNNSISVPLATVIGVSFTLLSKEVTKHEKRSKAPWIFRR